MKIGIDTSLQYQKLDVFGTLDFAADVGAEVAAVGRGYLKGYDPDHLKKVRAHADNLGLSLEMGMGCIDRHASNFRPELGTAPEQITKAIRAAQVLGSTKVQCFIGNLHNRLLHGPFEQRLKDAGDAIKSVRPLIAETGIRVAIENHGDSTARELAALIEDIGPHYAGVCLDTGNPVAIAEDPLLAVEILAPYALMTAFRDSLVWRVENGALAQWLPLGKGNTDLPAMVKLLQQHAPNVAFSLELIVGGAPKTVPYLDPDSELWQKVPHTPARDFVRFVALAEKGPAGPVEMVWRPEADSGPPSPELAERLKAQQRRVIAEGIAYGREVLGLGERKN